ncbi:hypothetical protein FQV26_01405 [Planococcus sp. CPCC 101016]|uniref:TIGR04104 family putative zinc finger protein n=1 Tax=Planococcus sp. CPCC 101016 TaxID=2599617 RepID=UPI0011B68227|nr:TIGR04104 family putative zinc finger protein [Planococcus sp. CPCC 101016]TWT06498.1 hypothetical protein FQV26_01405 [Planococcus sp. CPCC 101016]
MPHCQNCGRRWGLKDTWEIVFNFGDSKGRKCPECGETQYISKKSRNRSGIIGILMLVLIVLLRPLFGDGLGAAMLMAIPFAVMLVIVNL